MGFTWIHLNQVNVGTKVAVGCASYRRWCTLTGVSTCATVNKCTKHKKRCSKGKPLYVYSTYTKDKRIRSTVLKKDSDAENKNRGPKWHFRYGREVYPTLPKHVKIRQFYHPNPLVQEAWKFYSQAEILSDRAGRLFLVSRNRPCMDAESPLTQGHLPRSTFDLPEHPTASSAYHNTRRR